MSEEPLRPRRLSRMPVPIQHLSSHRRNRSTPVSTHQVLLPVRGPLVHRSSTLDADCQNTRRVTFDDSSHPAHRSRSRTVSSTARAITPVDSKISSLGGTTSTLECLPHRLNISKTSQPISSQQRIEELTREAGHLRQELAYHKETRAACMKFFDAANQAQQNLHNAIVEMSRKVAISEQRFENYWKSQSDGRNWEEHVF